MIAFSSRSPILRAISRGAHALNTESKRLIRRILIEGDALCGPVLDISDLESIAPAKDAPLGSGQVIVSNLELLLIQLLRGERDGIKRAPVTDEQGMQSLVDAAEKFMRDHPDGSIRMEDVCRHIGVGRTTLKRLFRQCREAGRNGTLSAFAAGRGATAAGCERAGSTYPKSPMRLGYSSLPAFSRQFRSRLGITPQGIYAYRRRPRTKAAERSVNRANFSAAKRGLGANARSFAQSSANACGICKALPSDTCAGLWNGCPCTKAAERSVNRTKFSTAKRGLAHPCLHCSANTRGMSKFPAANIPRHT